MPTRGLSHLLDFSCNVQNFNEINQERSAVICFEMHSRVSVSFPSNFFLKLIRFEIAEYSLTYIKWSDIVHLGSNLVPFLFTREDHGC